MYPCKTDGVDGVYAENEFKYEYRVMSYLNFEFEVLNILKKCFEQQIRKRFMIGT